MKTKLFFLLMVASIFQAKAIQHIRWGSSGDPLNGLTVTWRNAGTADSIQWGYTSYYEGGRFPGARRNGYAEYFFNYVFPTAKANSTIYYQLYDSKTKVWSIQMTYNTAPPSNTTSFSFLGVGDSRSGLSIWKNIASLANAQKTDFTIFTGDIVADGGIASQWDSWFNNATPFLQNNIVYHSLGNHDAASVPTYQNIFELPKTNGSNLYYSFIYGNTIFITLNSEKPGDATQAQWLTNTLSAAQSNTAIKWKVVSFHRPFYTIGSHAGEMNSYYNTWWKAFDDYGVDLILNGHDHMYERTKPINRKVSTTAPVAKYGSEPGQGRCEIVCGGAGAPLYTGSSTWFIQKYQSINNYCKFEVNDCSIKITAYNNSDAIIETFNLNKCSVTTGIGETVQKFNEIRIVPNPIESNFTLHYNSELQGEAIIRIYDMSGKEIAVEKINKTENDLRFEYDMSKYAKGVYSIEVIMGEQKDNALLILK